MIFVKFVFAMIDQSYDIIMIEYLFSNSIILTFLEKNINNNKSQHDISHVNEGSFFNVYFFVLRAKTFQHVFQMAIILPPSLPRYRNQQLIFVTFVFAMIDQSYDIIMIDYLFSNSFKWLSFFHLHDLRINNTINSSVIKIHNKSEFPDRVHWNKN